MKRITASTPKFTRTPGGTPYKIYDFMDDALIMSQSNPNVNGIWIRGGPFMVKKRHVYTAVVGPYDWYYFGPYTIQPFVGPQYQNPIIPETPKQLSDLYTREYNNTWAYGATGWKRTRPGNPTASVAQFTGELRDWLPNLPRKLYSALQTLLARKAAHKRQHGLSGLGDAHLNVQFGWLPLLSDIKKMYETYQKLDASLAQIKRDNGNGIHRSKVIKDDTSSSSTVVQFSTPFYGWGNAPANVIGGFGKVETVTTVSEKIWFVGKYRYYIPDIGSSEWSRKTTRALFGVNFTPEAAWELLPWSWLFDWFGNMGDVMSNMSSNAVDNLTADYAFVMRTLETRKDYIGTSQWNEFYPTYQGSSKYIRGGSVSATSYDSTVYKIRSVGSPFGFGATFDGLSPYQLGIAAALGISRWA
jgi:hypothetical protein